MNVTNTIRKDCGGVRGRHRLLDRVAPLYLYMLPPLVHGELYIVDCDHNCRGIKSHWENRGAAHKSAITNSIYVRTFVLIKDFEGCTGTIKVSIEKIDFDKQKAVGA